MDLETVVASVASSIGLSVATAAWLSRTLITHRLGLQRDMLKEQVAGEVKQRVDLALGERAAQREYEFEARKRLYQAIGPLRCQLIIACRDFSNRMTAHSQGRPYSLDPRYYYGRSTLYRLLRPIAVAELIERQVYFEDFSVDRDTISLFKFKEAAYSIFTGSELVLKHPGVDWNHEKEHLFYDHLAQIAEAVILADGSRVMRFTEFDRAADDPAFLKSLQPLPQMIGDLTPSSKPILWLRLVAFGALCARVLNEEGRRTGFASVEYPLRTLLAMSEDRHQLEHLETFEQRCLALSAIPFAPPEAERPAESGPAPAHLLGQR